jgi:AI-2 transport protein TqsA
MSQSPINPPDEGNGVAGSSTNGLRRPSLFRVIVAIAATVVVLVGMRIGAPILNPIFFALVLSLLFSPIYSWLGRRGLPAPLALLVMLGGLTVILVGLFGFLTVSIDSFTGRIDQYTAQLEGLTDRLQTQLDRLGLSAVDLSGIVDSGAIVGALGAALSGVAGFLGDLFLILMITLFLLAEGPALVNRLSSSLARDNPQLAGITTVGRSVVRQFGLRALINVITGLGVTILLLILGVDFALLWGVLTFFLSFVPYIGLILAAAPALLLALAEFGVGRAVLVIVGMIVIDTLVENVLSPMMMGRGLSLSPTVVFLSFTFWIWLLGAPGAFLAIPITIFAAVMLGTFPETRWLASLAGLATPESGDVAPGEEG